MINDFDILENCLLSLLKDRDQFEEIHVRNKDDDLFTFLIIFSKFTKILNIIIFLNSYYLIIMYRKKKS